MIILSLSLMSCSTIEKAKLDSSTPAAAIDEVEQLQQKLYKNQVDLLAHESFQEGTERLNEAKNELANNEDPKEIMNLTAKAKAYFQKAKKKANNKTYTPRQILESRKTAINHGARSDKQLNKRLIEIDHELRDSTDNFSEELENEEYSKYQNDYLELKVNILQHNELNLARQVLEKAQSNDAEDKAPDTLSKTKKSIRAAENLIAKNSSDPNTYLSSVKRANRAAKLLNDVMNKIDKMGEDTSEKVALKLVYQDRKIGKLSSQLEDVKGDLSQSKYSVDKITGKLQRKEQKLEKTSSKLTTQREIDEIRNNFDNDKAEIYQQGDKLIFRIKQIDFSVGSAKLPSDSLGLLTNIRSAIQELQVEEVAVHGHTDSTGSSELNQKLSQQRADAVAKYLKSIDNEKIEITTKGYGESKPLTTNNTKQGRAQNRRVDIVVSVK